MFELKKSSKLSLNGLLFLSILNLILCLTSENVDFDLIHLSYLPQKELSFADITFYT